MNFFLVILSLVYFYAEIEIIEEFYKKKINKNKKKD